MTKSIDDRVTFCTNCIGVGVHAGVVNITLGVALFTPKIDEKGNSLSQEVPVEVAVNSRLRLDLPAARALYAQLGDRLAWVDSQSEVGAGPIANGGMAAGAKPN
jgi:hypothetical protein